MYVMVKNKLNVVQIIHQALYCFIFAICLYSSQAYSASSYSTSIYTNSEKSVANAVILMYHNVSDDTPPSTSVTPETFKKHMQYLADNGFHIWSLSSVLTHLKNAKPIPEKTVIITFDDAYESVYSQAFPVLKEKSWPFTVFVTTHYIDEAYTNFMSWQQLREVQKFGAEIGNHSRTHAHLIRKRIDESKQQWRSRVIGDITQAQSILQEKTGKPIRVFAYPYGEYSKDLKKVLRELDYVALGQHSGALSYISDLQAIPRFPMATGFDEMPEYALKVLTKDLPVTVLSPDDGVLTKANKIPEVKFRLEAGDYKKSNLACYASGQGRIQLEWLDKDKDIVNVKANDFLKPGRTKYNCTAPSKSEANVFYWHSFLWMKPEADGSWYKE